ncbi:MAG: 3'-5' exonuclease [bacterium]
MNSKIAKSFMAIDFETADYGRDSACAVGMVRVENSAIVDRTFYHIRPPRRNFIFTSLHGISWNDVVDAPTFRQLWPSLRKKFANVEFLAAHNAGFDRSVLNECCKKACLSVPSYSFQCTMLLARKVWNIYPTTLPNVCKYLDISLNHHEAGSDAEACAKIILEAAKNQPNFY